MPPCLSSSPITRLRRLLARYEARRFTTRDRPPEPISTGWPALDDRLPSQGLPGHSLIEVLSEGMGSGAATLALRTALNAAGNQNACLVVVDCDGDFYPPAAAAMGLPVDRLLVVRTGRAADAFWATEQALRCRSVGAVLATRLLLDEVRSRRLQLAAERSGGMALVLSPFKKSTGRHSFAAVRLLIEPEPITPRQNGTRRFRVTVLKVREGMPVEPVILDTTDETFDVPLHPVPADRAAEEERSIEQRISA